MTFERCDCCEPPGVPLRPGVLVTDLLKKDGPEIYRSGSVIPPRSTENLLQPWESWLGAGPLDAPEH